MKRILPILILALLNTSVLAEDRVYAKQYISIETAVGIMGVVPGTILEHIKGDMYRVNGKVVDIKPWQVTRSAKEASIAIANDSRAQAKLSAEAKAAIAERIAAEDAAYLEAVEIAEKQKAEAPAYVNPLGSPVLNATLRK